MLGSGHPQGAGFTLRSRETRCKAISKHGCNDGYTRGMMTDTLTLADFLLARIAEDEEDVTNARYDPSDHWWLPDAAYPKRLLAECEAKRRIVERGRLTEAWIPTTDERSIGAINANRFTLQHLALPYADHPDYREEWRA